MINRRDWIGNAASGLGGIALAWLLREERALADDVASPSRGVYQSLQEPKAKRAIHIFSPGGVSHVDTFDYKPELVKQNGKPLTSKGKLDTFFGKPGNLLKNLWDFKQRGESGLWVSDLLPHLADRADDLTFIYTLTSKSSSHTPACFQMNTGFTRNGYPCVGSWLSYGLGTENEELPTFVVLPDHRGHPNGGSNNWSQGFLPAEHQGTAFDAASDEPIPNLITPSNVDRAARAESLSVLAELNRKFADDYAAESSLAARIGTYEMAARMQLSIPELFDFSDETSATLEMYGMHDPVIAPAAKNFLLARRMIERGVRFVQVFNGASLGGNPRINWDAHEDVYTNHLDQAKFLDRPCAALIQDLKQRGLLDETLVFWSSEFGRTPFTEGVDTRGRDHHNHCFTAWMAGAGLKPGIGYGISDEFGYRPAEHPATIYDLHATILHLFGIDHTQLTYYHNGIDRRLTDVHGHVLDDLLA